MKMTAVLPWMVLALTSMAGAAWADATIVTKTNEQTQTLQVGEHKLRMATAQGGMIFRGDKKLIWIVDTEKKSVTEMTELEMRDMASRVEYAMTEMKKLPPALSDKIMKSLPGATLPKRTVVALGVNKEINGFACSGYKVTTEGKDGTSEVWAAEPTAVKFSPADMAVFKEFADFMAIALPGLEGLSDWAKDLEHPKPDQVPGIPVLTIVKDAAGKEVARTELVSVANDAVAASSFEVPEGYSKSSMKTGK